MPCNTKVQAITEVISQPDLQILDPATITSLPYYSKIIKLQAKHTQPHTQRLATRPSLTHGAVAVSPMSAQMMTTTVTHACISEPIMQISCSQTSTPIQDNP